MNSLISRRDLILVSFQVLRVSYPGLPTHPRHAVAKQQMTAYGGMIMADIDGGVAGGKTVVEVRLLLPFISCSDV